MSGKELSVIQRFDRLFNDDFIEKATDEEVEICFERLKRICEQDNLGFAEMIGELEFYCNSFIDNVAGVNNS